MLTMLLTFSPLTGDVVTRLTEGMGDAMSVQVVRLHELNADASAVRSLQSGQAQGSVTLFDD